MRDADLKLRVFSLGFPGMPGHSRLYLGIAALHSGVGWYGGCGAVVSWGEALDLCKYG